jgi:hypothetical protein
LVLLLEVGGQRIVGNRNNVPPERAGQWIEILFAKRTVAFRRVIDAECEDVVRGRRALCRFRRNRSIRCPVDDGKDAMGRLARNDCFVPVILHLNLELGTTQKPIEEIEFSTPTRQACMSMLLSPSGSWI